MADSAAGSQAFQLDHSLVRCQVELLVFEGFARDKRRAHRQIVRVVTVVASVTKQLPCVFGEIGRRRREGRRVWDAR